VQSVGEGGITSSVRKTRNKKRGAPFFGDGHGGYYEVARLAIDLWEERNMMLSVGLWGEEGALA